MSAHQNHSAIPVLAKSVTHILFAAFLFLSLATPSWRTGPFTWWPLLSFPMLAGRPAELGLVSSLPFSILAGWMVLRLAARPLRPWRWGRPQITVPLLGLSALILPNLDPALTWRTVTQVLGLGLTWLVYLFVVNEKPDLILPLALVLVVQGSVALGQFLHQSDIGLGLVDEPTLDPEVSGVSVLWARGQRWLRAYGLTGHSNVLGATMAVLLLLVLRPLNQMKGWRKFGLTLVFSLGILGLLASFSRSSWLAFSTGFVVWSLPRLKEYQRFQRQEWERNRPQFRSSHLPFQFIFPFIIAAMFLLLYRDLVTSRFVELDTPIESRSIDERQRDADLAIIIIAANPVIGVGAGNYLPAARELEPDSRPVHNVLLLVAAELGLLGAVLWAALAAAGLLAHRTARPPWLAMLIISMFDSTLWLTTSWRAAILVGLLAGLASQTDISPSCRRASGESTKDLA
jgi:hypothetical protein